MSSKKLRARRKKHAAPSIPFVRDITADRFFGSAFYIFPTRRKALYEEECLLRNLYPEIRAVFQDHCFLDVDPREVLQAVIGNTESSVRWHGPVDSVPRGGYKPTFDFVGRFLIQERNLVQRLMEIIFSKKENVARNSAAVTLDCKIAHFRFDAENNHKEAVIFFDAGAPNDLLRVTIRAEGREPCTFTFEHTITWITNRYALT
jgi:hypothetical protein